jgi:hypothetical protein
MSRQPPRRTVRGAQRNALTSAERMINMHARVFGTGSTEFRP